MLLLTISIVEVAISKIYKCRRLDLTSISCSKLLSPPRRLSRGFSEGNRWGNLLWPPPGSRMSTVHILSAYYNSLDRIVGTVGNIATLDKYSFSSLPVEFSSLITSFDVTDTSDSVLRWTILVLTGIFCLNL